LTVIAPDTSITAGSAGGSAGYGAGTKTDEDEALIRSRLKAGPNHVLRIAPSSNPYDTKSVLFTLPTAAGVTTVGASGAGRAAVIEDSTRLNATANPGFLPSAIPVSPTFPTPTPAQQFYGAPPRTNVAGSGSAVNLFANQNLAGTGSPVQNVTFNTTIVANDFSLAGTSVTVQQAFVQLDRLVAGSTETAFSDNDALPITYDVAGPNARVTVLEAGGSGGQGRVGFWLHEMPSDHGGYSINFSVEQPTPEIESPSSTTESKNFSTFSRFPDMIATFRLAGGEIYNGATIGGTTRVKSSDDNSKQYYEQLWHIQFGSIIRSLGLENANNSIDESALGWGFSLSGNYGFYWDNGVHVADSFYGSITYGDGIAHYISDLHTTPTNLATSGNDAVLRGDDLEALHELAYYVGYSHSWFDWLESNATYSHVILDSVNVAGQSQSPYRFGDYAAVNLIYHVVKVHPATNAAGGTASSSYKFSTGLEYLFGRHETLDAHSGEDQRIMWVTEISN
jgi:hypothetical protein